MKRETICGVELIGTNLWVTSFKNTTLAVRNGGAEGLTVGTIDDD